jgi:hypothetical protein
VMPLGPASVLTKGPPHRDFHKIPLDSPAHLA